MRLSEITVDVKAQEEGEWRDHPYFDGVQVQVRSVHCEAYRKRRAMLMNRMPRRNRKIGDALLAQEEIERKALATLLVSWRGIEDEGGKALDYSQGLAAEWAEDDRYRKFYDGVRELAAEVGEQDAEAQEERLGN